MNIYYLDHDPRLCALYHNDRHVNKQILETVQLLCAAHIVLDGAVKFDDYPAIEPCVKRSACAAWARTNRSNYRWTHQLLRYLIEQQLKRFNRLSVYTALYLHLAEPPVYNMPDNELTAPAVVLPTKYTYPDPVLSYRMWYVHNRRELAHWSAPASTPEWWNYLSQKEGLTDEQQERA